MWFIYPYKIRVGGLLRSALEFNTWGREGSFRQCSISIDWPIRVVQRWLISHWMWTLWEECDLGQGADPEGLTVEGRSARYTLCGRGNKLFTEEGAGRPITASTQYVLPATWPSSSVPHSGYQLPKHTFYPSLSGHDPTTFRLCLTLGNRTESLCPSSLAGIMLYMEWSLQTWMPWPVGFWLLRKYSSITCWNPLVHWNQLG